MVKPPAFVPDAGDVVWLQFDPQAGHEQAGHRPAVVLSPAGYNGKTGLMVCCPLTTRIKAGGQDGRFVCVCVCVCVCV